MVYVVILNSLGDIVQLGDKVTFRFNHQSLVSSYTHLCIRFMLSNNDSMHVSIPVSLQGEVLANSVLNEDM